MDICIFFIRFQNKRSIKKKYCYFHFITKENNKMFFYSLDFSRIKINGTKQQNLTEEEPKIRIEFVINNSNNGDNTNVIKL